MNIYFKWNDCTTLLMSSHSVRSPLPLDDQTFSASGLQSTAAMKFIPAERAPYEYTRHRRSSPPVPTPACYVCVVWCLLGMYSSHCSTAATVHMEGAAPRTTLSLVLSLQAARRSFPCVWVPDTDTVEAPCPCTLLPTLSTDDHLPFWRILRGGMG